MSLVTAPTQHARKLSTSRYLLWIDGVGGFLLCAWPRVTIGHASARPLPDVPVLADMSRLHATLTRDAEGYALDAYRKVQVNGTDMERATLRTGDRITLGSSCQMLFTQPMPVSASARLEVVSGHRLTYPVSTILLMAETLVLSGGARGHVTVRELEQPIILLQNKDELTVRHDGPIAVNGQTFTDRAPLEPGRTVTVGEVSMTLEAV
jgi:hypothetical protein